jgi:hypothetical protein
MSKLYLMNRMRYAPAAGGLFTGIINFGKKLLGIGKAVAPTVAATLAKPAVQTGLAVAAGVGANALLSGGSGGSSGSGASGGWSGARRRRGITATELRGYRKVAGLIHKEGMVSKRARGRH